MPAVNPGPSNVASNNHPLIIKGVQLLFVLRNANMQLTTDQIFSKVFTGNTWDPYFITANWVSGAFSSACAGGIFSLPSKGGSAIVATGQSYSALTGATTHTSCTIQANNVTFTSVPILSLTTGNSASLFADFFIYGACYD